MKRRDFISLLGGAAATWPLTARAQQPAMPVIGFLSSRSPEDSVDGLEAFRRGLKEGGFTEGENVAIEFRWALGDYSRLPALATDLVGRQVAVIVAAGGEPSGLAAKAATTTIPIVFGIGGDPVRAGLVDSFSRPGGNVTGVTLLTSLMEPKRLGLLRDLVPGVALIGVLINPDFPPAALQLQQIEEAAGAIGQRIVITKASNDDALEAAFRSLVQEGAGALLVTAAPYFDTRRDRIIAFAARQRLPAIYQFREYGHPPRPAREPHRAADAARHRRRGEWYCSVGNLSSTIKSPLWRYRIITGLRSGHPRGSDDGRRWRLRSRLARADQDRRAAVVPDLARTLEGDGNLGEAAGPVPSDRAGQALHPKILRRAVPGAEGGARC